MLTLYRRAASVHLTLDHTVSAVDDHSPLACLGGLVPTSPVPGPLVAGLVQVVLVALARQHDSVTPRSQVRHA